VTATVGNVYEPYLEFLHRPDLLVEALARGEDLVDAAYYALPALSWQSIVIGDPLYRPFAVPLSAQMRNLSALPPRLAGYAVIRRMNLLDAEGRKAEAIEAGKAGMKEVPNLALALALARRLDSAGMGNEAAGELEGSAALAGTTSDNWEVMREAALFLAAHRRFAEAIDLFRSLFSIDAIPSDVRSSWLVEARQVALDSGDAVQAAEWKQEISQAVEKSLSGKP